MMIRKRFWMLIALQAIWVGMLWSPATLHAQDMDDDEFDRPPPPRRERPMRGMMRDPEQIERRIDYIRGQLERLRDEDADHPEIQNLEQRLQHLEKIRERMHHRKQRDPWGRPGPEDRFDRPAQYSEEEIREFLREHEDLAELFKDRKGKRGGRGIPKRHRRQISEIMSAFEGGDEELAHLMIESAQIQFRIGRLSREYRQVPEDSEERSVLRRELADLVDEQARMELHQRERELQMLRERLARQEDKLARDWARIDKIAEKKLQRLLSRKPKGERRREGRPKHRGRPRPEEVPRDELEE